MENDYTTPARRGAPLIQAALALLVAGTLVSFSVLAFRTGFAENRDRDVAAADVGRAGAAVVLPALGATESVGSRQVAQGQGVAITTTTDETVVLGTRVRATDATTPTANPVATSDDHRGRGLGHEKARGRGHHKDDGNGNHDGDGSWDEGQREAREEDDDADDHGDDADDRDDASKDSGSGSDVSDRSGSSGSREHSGDSN